MKNMIALVAALLMASGFASAKTDGVVTRPVVGCVTKSDIKEFYERARGNQEHMLVLIDSRRCAPIQGIRFALLDVGYPYVLIRIFTDEGSVKLWTLQSVIKND